MQRKICNFLCLITATGLLFLLAGPGVVLAASDPIPSIYYQDLVELFNRKSMNAPKPSALLVENGFWQTEIVIFRDVEYGSEVWKLTNDPDYSFHHNSVNRSPWNCDGSLISMMSARNVPGLPYEGWFHYFLIGAAGDSLRILNLYGNSRTRAVLDNGQITAWDRFSSSLMYFGYADGLYKVDVRNNDLMTLEEPLPNTSVRKQITSFVSENNKVLVNDRNTGDPTYFPMIYMIDLKKPSGSPDRVKSYSIHFNLTGIAGHDVATEDAYHDLNFMRTPDDAWQLNYEGPNGGEMVTFRIPYDGDRDSISIAFTDYDPVYPYYSHPSWRYDGQYVVFGGQSRRGVDDWGLQCRNQATQTPVAVLTPLLTCSDIHTAWDGYDPDWAFASCMGAWPWAKRIIKAKTDGSLTTPIVNTNTRINGTSSDYSTLPRPAQSPDGTKVAFTSSMLQTVDTKADLYVAVARRPYPPVNVRVLSISRTQVLLAWDRPRIARETKGFHVYRSTDADNQYVEISPALIPELVYADNTVTSGHTYYYAVTSEEFSGLESDYLSNVPRASISTSSSNWDNYRAEGQKGWDATAPGQIGNLTVSQLSSGVFQLTWQAPSDKDVRYYNIYYSVAGPPASVQERLIASPGRTSTRLIDWQASPVFSPFYGVTAVDRQGNESLPRYFPSDDSDVTPPAPVRDFR